MIRVFENTQLNLEMETITTGNEHYFKAKEVARALGYERPKDAIREHVSEEYKKRLSEIKGAVNHSPFNSQPHSLYLSEPGLYELVFGSRLPAAKEFRRWVFEEVLPSIRKTGGFRALNKQMFKIENEFDLHRKVVDYIRRFYPGLLFIAGLGELQDTSDKRIKSWQKGYQKGQPDLMITNHHKHYNGFCLEFKTPKGNGVLSGAQRMLLCEYEKNGYLILVSNDYDTITRAIQEYCTGIRVPYRANIGSLVVFYTPSKSDLETILSDYGGEISKEQLHEYMRHLKTHPHSKMVFSLRYPYDVKIYGDRAADRSAHAARRG